MKPSTKPIKLADAKLSLHKDGFWLYDNTRGMNLSMGSKNVEEVLEDVLRYYQRRLTTVEKEYRSLQKTVSEFVTNVSEGLDDE